MTVPLVILAVFSVFLGWGEGPFDRFVHFAGVEAPPPSLGVLSVSVLVAAAGWLAAGVVYFWRIVPSEGLRRSFGPVYTLLVRKYYVDDLYAGVVLGLGGPAIRLAGMFDHYVVDGLVNLTGWVARQMGLGLRYVQTGRAENYLLLVFLGVVVIVLVTLAW